MQQSVDKPLATVIAENLWAIDSECSNRHLLIDFIERPIEVLRNANLEILTVIKVKADSPDLSDHIKEITINCPKFKFIIISDQSLNLDLGEKCFNLEPLSPL